MIQCSIDSSRLRTVGQILCRVPVSSSHTCVTGFSVASKLGTTRVGSSQTCSGSSSLSLVQSQWKRQEIDEQSHPLCDSVVGDFAFRN